MTVSSEENMDLIELVCSQGERPHTDLALKKIAKSNGHQYWEWWKKEIFKMSSPWKHHIWMMGLKSEDLSYQIWITSYSTNKADKPDVKKSHGIHCNFMVWCKQTFFVNNNGIKVNKENYCWHLHEELFPNTERVVKRDDWIFSQDGAPSHRSHLVQDFLKTKLKRRFIRAEEWPPSWCKPTGLFLQGLC